MPAVSKVAPELLQRLTYRTRVERVPVPRISVPLFANFVLFQAVWLITVIGASRGQSWPGLAALAFFLSVHYVLAPRPGVDYVTSAVAVVVGIAVETVNVGSGLIVYESASFGAALPPAWILVLWCSLGLTLNNSLAWLQQHLLWAALLGAAGGTLSYLGGVALGAADLGVAPSQALPFLALTWAGVTPLLMLFARTLRNYAATR